MKEKKSNFDNKRMGRMSWTFLWTLMGSPGWHRLKKNQIFFFQFFFFYFKIFFPQASLFGKMSLCMNNLLYTGYQVDGFLKVYSLSLYKYAIYYSSLIKMFRNVLWTNYKFEIDNLSMDRGPSAYTYSSFTTE